MASLESTHAEASTARRRHPAVLGLLFVALVAVLNVALNGVLGGLQSALPSPLQFEYVVTAPLTPLGASALFVAAGVLTVCALGAFVRSVGGTGSAELEPTSFAETVRRFARATVVAFVGTLAAAFGLLLFVLPGLVVLVYLPFVFVAVVLDGRSVGGAVEVSHTRVSARPGLVAATALATVSGLLGLGLGGVFTSALPPVTEFAVGGTGSALVALAGAYLLTALYRRLPVQSSPTTGRL